MTKFSKFFGTTALVALIGANSATADVSAQDVWGDWQSYLNGFGYDTTATTSTSGDTLTLSDMVMGMDLPDGAGRATVSIGEIGLHNRGDGSVGVNLPPVVPMTVHVEPRGEDPVDVALEYRSDGLSMVISGDPNEMTYETAANALTLALAGITVKGATITPGTVEVKLTGVSGKSVMSIGNIRTVTQDLSAAQLSYDIDVRNPDKPAESFAWKGSASNLSSTGSGSYPMGEFDMQNMAAMLAAGFAFDATLAYDGGSSNFHFVGDGQNIQMESSSDSGSLQVAMSQDQLRYGGVAKGVAATVAGGDIPFPVSFTMGESGFTLDMPVSKSDDEQPFQLALAMRDFTISDMIWGIFDPQGQLPRDPATIALDLSGAGKLFLDLFDPEQMAKVEGGEAMPGQVNAVSVNDLVVSAAGASLTGQGDFEIDNTDMQTFPGMPAPSGALNLKLVGGNGLLDKLVAMGLVPEDQAMGARMMMGLFGVPGEGEDTINSTIEVKDGQVLANGQRIK